MYENTIAKCTISALRMLVKRPWSLKAWKEARSICEFAENNDMPMTRKIVVSVAVSGHEMPGFGAYLQPSINDEQNEGLMFPRGKILLNMDAILNCCVENDDISPFELAADCITHELIHAIQDLFCESVTEYGIEEAIYKVRKEELNQNA